MKAKQKQAKEVLAIYVEGERHIESYIKPDGFVAYQDNPTTPDAYLASNPGAIILPLDDAVKKIRALDRAEYCKPWVEISKETWWDMLEVLPPEKWQTVGGVEMFRMSEYTCGNITGHYARIGERYFSADREAGNNFDELAFEVLETAGKEVNA